MTFVKTALFHKAGEGSGGGGGGGDQHNLGWYATEAALESAHATATDGDWAIVGATDTVWVWDSDTTAWVDTGAAGIELPDQTGQSGKFLTTDGSSASWSAISALQNTATSTGSLTILGTAATWTESINIGNSSSVSGPNATVVGDNATGATVFGYSATGTCSFGRSAKSTGAKTVSVGDSSESSTYGTAVGAETKATGNSSVAIGTNAKATATCAYMIGPWTNSNANTLKIGFASNSYELLSSDGTIPEARFADTTNAQQGDVLTLDSTGNAVWQAGSGGGLPSQTGNAGKFLTTDGTDASWSDKPLVNTATGTNSISVLSVASGQSSVVIGDGVGAGRNSVSIGSTGNSSTNNGSYAIAIGTEAYTTGSSALSPRIAIGNGVTSAANRAIQLGFYGSNSDANTFKVANANGNFEIMDANGNLPADRLASTTGLADGNYRLRLTMTNGVPTLSWVAE